MTLQTMRQRLDLIDSILPSSKSEELAQAIKDLIKSSENRDWLADTYLETTIVCCIYALTRHLAWHDTPIFQELLAEYLRSELNLPSDTATAIYAIGTRCLANSRPRLFSDMEVDSDRHFLRYLFIASAIAKDEQQLASDLGLGNGVLRRIKAAASWIVTHATPQNKSGSATPREFMPALDVCFAETMLDFTREMRKTPWIVDLHRLKYKFLETSEPLRSIVESCGTEKIFNVLLEMAKKHAVKCRFDLTEIQSEMTKASIFEIPAGDFIQLLESVHVLSNSFEKGFKPRYCLTPFGEELTAEAYVHTESRLEFTELIDIASMPLRYQAAWVKNIPTARMAELRSYLASHRDKAFAHPAMEQAIKRLALAVGPVEIVQLCNSILESVQSPFFQKAVVQGLSDQIEQKPVRQFLQKIAESTLSALATETAKIMLLRAGVGKLEVEPPGLTPLAADKIL